MAKLNKAINEQRITEVMQLLLQGAESNEIRQYAASRGWQVTNRQLRRYIGAAYKRTTESLEQKQEELLGRHLLQRRSLYARCLKAEDFRTALQILHDEAELLGLYPAKKIAPTTPDGKEPYDAAPGLVALLPELERALDRLGCGASAEDHAPSESGSHAGADPARSGTPHGMDGDAARPLATEIASFAITEELTPLLPPSGQEHSDGSPGPEDGDS